MGDAGPPPRSLGERLVERRLFVGRSAEVELLAAALDSAEPSFAVLFITGPGGIGKSALLERCAELVSATDAVLVRLDGRIVAPTPEAVLAALGEELDVPDGDAPITGPTGRRIVVLMDAFERLGALEGWLRTGLLPRLPASALTLVSGREAPGPDWRADSAWSELLRVVSLRNLGPAECREYLDALHVDASFHGEILHATHGHPLALSLLADVVVREGGLPPEPLPPDLVRALVERFVDHVPSELHRRALQVCGLARVTTEALLRDALDLKDARAMFTWLRDLSFVDAGAEGLFPHDLARDVLDADLRWRDRDAYASVFRGVWTHAREHLRSTTGREQRQAVVDLKFVFRNLPGVLSPVDWASWGGVDPERARPSDREAVLALTLAAEGQLSRDIAAFWWDRQPEAFHVLRQHDGSVLGLLVLVDLTRATPEDRSADPGTRAAWDFAQRRSPTRPGEVVTQTRFVIDRHAYQDPSPTLNAAPVLAMERYLRTGNLAWDFLTLAQPERWDDYFAIADLPRAEGADFEVGGRVFGLFAHDFRQVSVDDWLELVTERALWRDVHLEAPTKPQLLVLSQPEFAQAVKQALHDLRHPYLLARNPLVRTRMVQDAAGPPPSVLESLVRDAVDSLAEDPRDDKLLRAIDRTYLRPAGTQESAAAMLALPFSTYRRHLTRGVARVVDWMWQREVYGPRREQQ